MRIGIRDVAQNSALNYPALVVATAPSETQFTATAGPGANIPSVTSGPFASGFVFFRSALGYATDGASVIFENASATNGSFYIRSQSGDVLPSGALAGNHSTTLGSTASVQAINAALAYAFQPTTEFRLSAFVDGLQWTDGAIDAVTGFSHRLSRSQVVPDHNKNYKLRLRATNNPSRTQPVAQIVSATKTGTTTATVVTDVPHGLTTGDVRNVVRSEKRSGPTLSRVQEICTALDLEIYIEPRRELVSENGPQPYRRGQRRGGADHDPGAGLSRQRGLPGRLPRGAGSVAGVSGDAVRGAGVAIGCASGRVAKFELL